MNVRNLQRLANEVRQNRVASETARNAAEMSMKKAAKAAEMALAREQEENKKLNEEKFIPFSGTPSRLEGKGNTKQWSAFFHEARQRRERGEGLANKNAAARLIRLTREARQAEIKAQEAAEKEAANMEKLRKETNRVTAEARRKAKEAANRAAAEKSAKANAAARNAEKLRKEAEAWASAVYAREKLAYNKAARAGARRRAAAENKAARLGAALAAQRRANKNANERRRTRLANEARQWNAMVEAMLQRPRGIAAFSAQRAMRPLFGPENMRTRPKRN